MTDALDAYRDACFYQPGLARVAELSLPVAAELFEAAVTLSPRTAVTILDKALAALMGGPVYGDDHAVSDDTLGDLSDYLSDEGPAGEDTLLKVLAVLTGAEVISRASRLGDPKTAERWFAGRTALEAIAA